MRELTPTQSETARPEVAQALRELDAAQAALDANEALMFDATRRAIAAQGSDAGAYASAMLDQRQAYDAGMELLNARSAASAAVLRLVGRSRFAIGRKADGSHSLRLISWKKGR